MARNAVIREIGIILSNRGFAPSGRQNFENKLYRKTCALQYWLSAQYRGITYDMIPPIYHSHGKTFLIELE